jgi:hypothetical protein
MGETEKRYSLFFPQPVPVKIIPIPITIYGGES